MASNEFHFDIKPSLWVALAVTFTATVPGLWIGLTGAEIQPVVGVLIFGIAVFGAAFILSWGAEAIQIDISES